MAPVCQLQRTVFSSEAWGGRSANRGQCAQACRLPYGLVIDGEPCDQGTIDTCCRRRT